MGVCLSCDHLSACCSKSVLSEATAEAFEQKLNFSALGSHTKTSNLVHPGHQKTALVSQNVRVSVKSHRIDFKNLMEESSTKPFPREAWDSSRHRTASSLASSTTTAVKTAKQCKIDLTDNQWENMRDPDHLTTIFKGVDKGVQKTSPKHG